MSFIAGIKTEVKDLLQSATNEALYLSRASAESLAGRLPVQPVVFGKEGTPFLPLFGGALVAADIDLPPMENGDILTQRTWLPVMDAQNNPIPVERMSARDVNDAQQRCIVKALAMTTGIGAAPFLGFSETREMLVKLGIKPDSDLATVAAYTKSNDQGKKYAHWMAALIAARLTDPHFHWEVVYSPAWSDRETGEIWDSAPVYRVAGGWSVQVQATYRGITRCEWLPLMGGPEHADILRPTVFDWNTAVMRALTKVIAYLTGYGLDVYAGEDLEKLVPKQVAKPSPKAQTTKPEQAKAPSSQTVVSTTPADTAATPVSNTSATPQPSGQGHADAPASAAPSPAAEAPEASSPQATDSDAEKAPVKTPEPEAMSENLKANLARVKTVTDVARLQGALRRADELFGAEAPVFKKAVQSRLAELEALAATV